MTIYGDAILPRGGAVGLATLARIVTSLGFNEGALRTALSRLARDGWVDRTRIGRNSFYSLTARSEAIFLTATEHIYDPPDLPWTGRFEMLIATGEAAGDTG